MIKPKQQPRPFRILDYPLFDMAKIVAMVHSNIVDQAPGDLTPSKWRVIAHLGEQGVLTINELARLAVLERSALSRVVENLEHEGIVTRRRNSADNRAIDVFLTAPGRRLYAKCTLIARSEIENALDILTDMERRKLGEYLARVRGNIGSHSRRAKKATSGAQ